MIVERDGDAGGLEQRGGAGGVAGADEAAVGDEKGGRAARLADERGSSRNTPGPKTSLGDGREAKEAEILKSGIENRESEIQSLKIADFR